MLGRPRKLTKVVKFMIAKAIMLMTAVFFPMPGFPPRVEVASETAGPVAAGAAD
jgi:hypothetical protein